MTGPWTHLRPRLSAPGAHPERGMTLVWSTASVLFVAGIVLAATTEMRAFQEVTQARFAAQAQAGKLAQAGIVDAHAWFRRQTVQPVAAFTPQRDLGADPPINETDDVDIGLVREYEVTPGIWGRYEVREGTGPEPFSDANGNGLHDTGEAFTDVDSNGVWTPGHDTRDVTDERGRPGSGASWHLESVGMIFHRPRADLALGEGPNRRLGMARLATEIRRMTIAPPAEAAVCAADPGGVTIYNRGRIRAPDTAVATGDGAGSVDFRSGSEILAPTGSTKIPDYASGVRDVFGVDLAQLKSMADISTSDAQGGLPSKIPDYSLVVVEGDPEFDVKRPLRGLGVLVINGNLLIDSGSNSFFSGVIYVTGDVRIEAPCYLRGTLIVNGDLDLLGTSGDYAEMEHDPDVVSRLLTVMGQYRYSQATYTPDGGGG